MVAAALSSASLLSSEYLVDHLASADAPAEALGSRVGVVHGQRDQGFPESPTASPRPRSAIQPEPLSKCLAALAEEERPRDRQVAGRITHGGAAEVDDGAQAAIDHEEIRAHDVAVHPDWRLLPLRGQGCLPDLCCCARVDAVRKRGDRGSGLGIVGRERPTAEEAVLPCRRAARRVDLVEGGEEGGEVVREELEVVDSLHSRGLALKPAVHRPRPREGGLRLAPRHGLGYPHGELRREDGQPAVLLVDLRDVPVGARQPNGELIAEPEGRVVPAVEFYPRDGQVRPLRELPFDQPGHERWRDCRLVQAAILVLHVADTLASYLRIEERELEAGGVGN